MRTVIANPRLLGLLLSSVSTLFVGMSLFPIFPHYAAELGAGPGAVGASLAVIYVANALGPMAAGLLARRIPRKPLFIAAGVLGPPSIALLGYVTALWQAVALMAVAWFCGGVIFTLVNIFTGIYAAGPVRGRAYALMSLSAPLGALLGGAATTALLSRFDFTVVCLGLAGVWAILPLTGLLTLDARAEQRQAAAQAREVASASPGSAFYLVLAASLLGHIAIAVGRLGTSLLMQAQELPAADVAATAAISGAASIPLILLFGALADRFGRRQAFALSSLLAALGVALQVGAAAPWQFWLAATLLLAANCASSALGAALAADIVGQAALGGAMARYTGTASVAAVISFAGAGYAFALLGPAPLFTLAALLGLVATAFVLWGSGRQVSRPVAAAVVPGGD